MTKGKKYSEEDVDNLSNLVKECTEKNPIADSAIKYQMFLFGNKDKIEKQAFIKNLDLASSQI